jgi:hypothetical protein
MTPFSVGERVQIVSATDLDIHDVSHHIGRVGRVEEVLEKAGCGDQYPEDPMIKVRFVKKTCVFWKEELSTYKVVPLKQSTRSLLVVRLMLEAKLSKLWKIYFHQDKEWYYHPARLNAPTMLHAVNIGRELRRRGARR